MSYRTVALGVSILFVMAFVMPVFVMDRALVWDDWIWIHSSPEQLRDVAIQLGFWWLADLNVFIYTLKNPNFFLSSIAFCSHVISVALLGRLFVKFNVLNDVHYIFWIVCCILSPFLLVRYTNSVAFYNLYFLCFICATYLFVFFKNKLARLLSAFLFIVSFSLNSLILAYFVIILLASKDFIFCLVEMFSNLSLKSGRPLMDFCGLVLSRMLNIWPFISLPFVFYIIKFLSPYDKTIKNPYVYYNFPQIDSVLWSPLITLKKTLELFFAVIWYGFSGVHPIGLLLFLVVTFSVLVIVFFLKKVVFFRVFNDTIVPYVVVCQRKLLYLFLLSCVLIFPYIFVGKPPVLGSFIEARHFLTAEPFIFAIAILVISNVGHFFGRFVLTPRITVVVLLTVFTSFYVWRTVLMASSVWFENKVSNYIIDVIRHNKSNLKFWVFDNQVPDKLDTKRWNYVYTGFLISAFGTKDNFGISKEEYFGWDQPVKLLSDPYYRSRYNIENYVHQGSHNYVTIKLLREMSSSSMISMYLIETFGVKSFEMAKLVSVYMFKEFNCVDQAVSLFSPDKLNQGQITPDEQLYCQNTLKEYCKSIKKGAQVIELNRMDYAYALQKYPSHLDSRGLRIFVNTNFEYITEGCSLVGVDFFTPPRKEGTPQVGVDSMH